MMAVAAAQKNREMFAIKKSYSIEVNLLFSNFYYYCFNLKFGFFVCLLFN